MNHYFDVIRDNIKQYRINYPLTQSELADRSGVSVRSITRFENGGDITLTNLIKLLDSLGLADNLLTVVPDESKRPSAYLQNEVKKQRASSKRRTKQTNTFKWGDEK